MKKFMFIAVLALVVVLGSGSAFAANSLQQGKLGISTGFGTLSLSQEGVAIENFVLGRYMASSDLAVIAGFGLFSGSGDIVDATDTVFAAGVRKYMKRDDFAPYIEGIVLYASQETSGPTGLNIFGVLGNYGAEYFLGKQFSLEGSVGVNILSISTKEGPSANSTLIGVDSLGVRANFYF